MISSVHVTKSTGNIQNAFCVFDWVSECASGYCKIPQVQSSECNIKSNSGIF